MWPKETKPECCIDPEPLPSNTKCMTQNICEEFSYLSNRHRRRFIKNNRIMKLAMINPRQRVTRFINKCPCNFKKNPQIIRVEQRSRTRTEQLALPKARSVPRIRIYLLRNIIKMSFSILLFFSDTYFYLRRRLEDCFQPNVLFS